MTGALPHFVVTGTDTGVGKTVFSAALAGALQAWYWKPVQAGLESETDTQTVARLSGLPGSRLLRERYRLALPASPHRAAREAGQHVDLDVLTRALHDIRNGAAAHLPLVVEGAGGVLVPLDNRTLYVDAFARWQLPVIVCARTTLGTINHTLLTLEALAQRAVAVHGIVFVGEAQPDSESAIVHFSGVRRLGRLPRLDRLTAAALRTAFDENFDRALFRQLPAGSA
jgi:dethiobiotin synthetase